MEPGEIRYVLVVAVVFLSFFSCSVHLAIGFVKVHATECLSVCALGRQRELEITPLSLQSSRSAAVGAARTSLSGVVSGTGKSAKLN